MQNSVPKERNKTLDVVRGFAMLMVILGHTISGNSLVNYENTILFKLIWSLQMPLFILISGYVAIYSRPIRSARDLMTYIGKRTLAYILPWVVWTFLIRGFLIDGWRISQLGEKLRYTLWNMDSGYWFLFSLWTICLIWGIGSYLAGKLSKQEKVLPVFTALASMILACGLFIVGIIWGMSFLAIKLSLYYLVFYFVSYLYSRYVGYFNQKAWFQTVKQIAVACLILVYAYLIINYNTYTSDDSVPNIGIRMLSSFAGCVVFISAISFWIEHGKNSLSSKVQNAVLLAGENSLGLYLSHNLFLSIIPLAGSTELVSLTGLCISFANYLLVILCSSITVYIISHNKWSRLALLGKK